MCRDQARLLHPPDCLARQLLLGVGRPGSPGTAASKQGPRWSALTTECNRQIACGVLDHRASCWPRKNRRARQAKSASLHGAACRLACERPTLAACDACAHDTAHSARALSQSTTATTLLCAREQQIFSATRCIVTLQGRSSGRSRVPLIRRLIRRYFRTPLIAAAAPEGLAMHLGFAAAMPRSRCRSRWWTFIAISSAVVACPETLFDWRTLTNGLLKHSSRSWESLVLATRGAPGAERFRACTSSCHATARNGPSPSKTSGLPVVEQSRSRAASRTAILTSAGSPNRPAKRAKSALRSSAASRASASFDIAGSFLSGLIETLHTWARRGRSQSGLRTGSFGIRPLRRW